MSLLPCARCELNPLLPRHLGRQGRAPPSPGCRAIVDAYVRLRLAACSSRRSCLPAERWWYARHVWVRYWPPRPANPVNCPKPHQGLLSSSRRRDLVVVDVATLRADTDEAIGHLSHGINYGSA